MRYLFRLDMAKDNEVFLNLRRSQGIDHVFAGSPIRVGPGWIPDFVEVSVQEDPGMIRLTLIELEATDIAARASCRKYLPENSSEVLGAFLDYLDNVISQCRTTADPRLKPFEHLKGILGNNATITAHTAGALRTSADFIEDLPLLDQPERLAPPTVGGPKISSRFSFCGERRLSRAESNGLLRAIRILHAVVVGRDHSGGILQSWRNTPRKPLDDAVAKDPSRYPHLHKPLKAKTDSGLSVNCDALGTELAHLWSSGVAGPMTADRVAKWVDGFVPHALTFAMHDRMQDVFEQARAVIDDTNV